MERPDVTWDRGVHVLGSVLWLDARRPDVLTFLSSARVREAARRARALCSDRTRTLVRAVRKEFSPLVAPFGQAIRLGPLELTLFPSGHMPGAAILRMVTDGGVLAYASHVALRPHRLAEVAQVPTCDVLVVRADYGHLPARLPARDEALARVVDVARQALQAGRTPVFLGSLMGKSQEVVRALVDAGVPVKVHRTVAAVDEAYRSLGFDPGPARQLRGRAAPDHALVLPESLRFRRSVQELPRRHLVWLSGRALMPEALARMQVDEGIALTGHLDPDGIESLVERSGASRVVTVGHGAEAVAERARRRGLDAVALHDEIQLSMF